MLSVLCSHAQVAYGATTKPAMFPSHMDLGHRTSMFSACRRCRFSADARLPACHLDLVGCKIHLC